MAAWLNPHGFARKVRPHWLHRRSGFRFGAFFLLSPAPTSLKLAIDITQAIRYSLSMTTYLTDAQMDALAPRSLETYRLNMGPRLAEAASKHLGCPVVFARWQPSTFANGPETPVFRIPADYVGRARQMGLAVVDAA